MGLLTKVTALSNDKGVENFNFSAFCLNYNLCHAGVFNTIDNVYVIENAFRVDFNTITRSFSTKTFWEGSLPETEKWYVFSKKQDNIQDFYQFFSDDLREQIESISFIRIERKDSSSLIFFHTSLKNETETHFTSDKDFINDLRKYQMNDGSHNSDEKNVTAENPLAGTEISINVKKACEEFVDKANLPTSSLKETVMNTIAAELFHELSEFTKDNGMVKRTSDFIYKIYFRNEQNYSSPLLENVFTEFLKNCFKEQLFNSFEITISENTSAAKKNVSGQEKECL